MKISYNWLKDYIKTDKSPEEISVILTNIGLEVESLDKVESIKGGLEGFVIGEVLSNEKHLDADRLSLTKVNIGNNIVLDIVCGAPNIDKGQKVVVATVGTKIYNGDEFFEIKKSKIRGAISEGMICAEDELGIGNSHDGILVLDKNAEIGIEASKFFNISSDFVFEIGLTPNRIDAASHIGVARDIATFLSLNKKISINKPEIKENKISSEKLKIEVKVHDSEACPRYSGVCIKNVKVEDSPKWIQDRLKAIGLRPINNIVDITNYVLHETGQPLHAFDYNKIAGNKVNVRVLKNGTKFITLDEQERELTDSDLMICDSEKGMCIAGVFGGIDSGVNSNTINVFLESAYFSPSSVRKTSKKHGIFSDSSFRFERGTDPNNVIYALNRASNLICEIANGEIASDIIDIYPNIILQKEISVSISAINRLIGKEIQTSTIKTILQSLDIEIIQESNDELKLKIPTYRVDVCRESDIVEEILRIYGFNNVEIPIRLNSSITHFPKPDKENIQNKISSYLSLSGFNEIMCNSLTSSSFNLDKYTVKILNPLSSDLDVMRNSLLYGGLQAISNNINRQNSDLKLYEFGYVYNHINKGNKKVTEKYQEDYKLAIFTTGNIELKNWNTDSKKADFYYLKSIAENIIKAIGIDRKRINISDYSNERFSKSISYLFGNDVLCLLTEIDKKELKRFDIKESVYYCEFNWDIIFNFVASYDLKVTELPKFPEVRRDFALILDKKIKFEDIYKKSFQIEKDILKNVNLFDVYEGDKISKDKKSYAISFILRDDTKTLNESQIDGIMSKLLKAFEENFDAKLR